jgi:hypothetical protein
MFPYLVRLGGTMSDIVENYAIPEIFADELAQIHISRDVMRFVYWAWQMSPGGVLQRTIVSRMAMPLDGVKASRPIINAAMEKHGCPIVSQYSEMAVAH